MLTLNDFVNTPGLATDDQVEKGGQENAAQGLGTSLTPDILWYAPFNTPFDFCFVKWFNNHRTNTYISADTLVHDVLLSDDFRKEDIPLNWSCKQVCEVLDHPPDDIPLLFSLADGWKEYLVDLPLPCYNFSYASESDAPTITVTGIWLCNPI